uniref:Uncharacterized protein n=1 Tax=Rhizophora mucronata TaxID=61149 RepID=A0A2P2NZ93_RHIMU
MVIPPENSRPIFHGPFLQGKLLFKNLLMPVGWNLL